jgi:hypothetical protein
MQIMIPLMDGMAILMGLTEKWEHTFILQLYYSTMAASGSYIVDSISRTSSLPSKNSKRFKSLNLNFHIIEIFFAAWYKSILI